MKFRLEPRGLWYNKARFEACFSYNNSVKGIPPVIKLSIASIILWLLYKEVKESYL
jgi:hypothetical protein